MSKGYWLATYKKIGDIEKLKKYAETVTPIIKSFGGQALVRGGTYQVLEGESFIRTVIWAFPNYEAAEKCYNSKEYQEAWSLAKNSTERNLQIIEGV